MLQRVLGATGIEVSVLGFGGAPIGFLEASRRQVSRILRGLLDEGVNLIDTAAMYAGSEEAIGEALEGRRDEVVLVSKCPDATQDGPDCWRAPAILASVERSLRRLRTDRLDVVLLHSCDRDVLDGGEALGALLEAQAQGKIRFAGYSGDNTAASRAADLADITVIETSVSICDQANLQSVVPKACAGDIGVVAKRPIANAAWRPLTDQRGLYREYAKTYTERFRAMDLSLEALGIEGDPAEVWPRVALRFTLFQPGVHAAIVGTCSPEHARANLAAIAQGPLPDAADAAIRAAFRRAEKASGKAWEGQT
ncbi:MAG: aldo/keto reductase [Lentisphaeria bacterium]|nr:aldo/keto reductase [Lentisphaeria bacterium]